MKFEADFHKNSDDTAPESSQHTHLTDSEESHDSTAQPAQEAGPIESDIASPTADEKTWGMCAHLVSFCAGVGVPLGNILGPLVIWLMKKEESAYIGDHAKEALNFNISVMIYLAICAPLMFIVIGFLMAIIVIIAAIVLTIMAAIKASNGEMYTYPYTIRFVK